MFRVSIIAGALCLGAATPSVAQTVVPPKHQGTLSVTFEDYHHTGHFDRLGNKNSNGATESKVVITQLDFGLSDNWGLNLSVPFIASQYTGPDVYYVEGIETHPGPLDDRTYHGAFQDARLELRRMFIAGPSALMPFVSLGMPTHHYETVGEAIPGRYRPEFQTGVSTETSLDALLPRTYINARYIYTDLKTINGFPHKRSNIDVQPGFLLTSRIDVRGIVSWQVAHRFPTIPELKPDWYNHDRFIVSDFTNAGAGASIWLNKTTELYGFCITAVRGKRGAHVATTIGIGVNRSFGGSGLPTLGK